MNAREPASYLVYGLSCVSSSIGVIRVCCEVFNVGGSSNDIHEAPKEFRSFCSSRQSSSII